MMSVQEDILREKANQRQPAVVDDDYLTDIAKRLRMLRSFVLEDTTELTRTQLQPATTLL